MKSPATLPVALFAYARPALLAQVLDALRRERVPLIHAFSDAARDATRQADVDQVRRMLRGIDWCETVVTERPENLGLGRSLLAGITEVLAHHDRVIVFEDDLVCVPGTYAYLAAALEHYRDQPAVTSVGAWNHPRLTPPGVGSQPYFSGRGEIWGWGTWARAWRGMERDARSLLTACRERGIDVYRYGADLALHAEIEADRNIWAVRFILAQMLAGGLALCPPWSMVENVGFGGQATNTGSVDEWSQGPLRACPPIPDTWPAPVEHPEVAALYRAACGEKPGLVARWSGRMRRSIGRAVRTARILPAR